MSVVDLHRKDLLELDTSVERDPLCWSTLWFKRLGLMP